MTDTLVIDESNFDDYFFDVRKHAPKEGQVLAKFKAIATFGGGSHKDDVLRLLKVDKAKEASMVMRKLHFCREPDCYRVCREMCDDLASGMSEEEVNGKEYEYVLEAYYYTQRECIPKDDPHWETIQLLEYDPETKGFSVRIELGDSDEQGLQRPDEGLSDSGEHS